MKKILILTAGFGEGEDVAAANVRDAIEHLAPQKTRLEVLDLLDSCYGRFHDLLRNTFETASNRTPKRWYGLYQLLGTSQIVEGQIDGLTRLQDSLRDALRGFKPDVVVVTCPIYSFLIGEIYRDGRIRDFTLVSLLTDAVVGNSLWPKVPADFFAVANEAAGRMLIAGGVPEKKIEVFGFPVQWRDLATSGKFENVLPDLTSGGRARILYVINGARKKAPKVIDRLLEHPEWDVTVCVGRDTDMDEMAREKAATAPGRMEVIGYTRRLPQLLREHHAVISRAEAGMVQEAIAEIHAQGGLAVASHPHEMKSEWGKDTLYFWEHVEEYAPLLDAWEVANRDDIFNPVGLKKLPFIANSDFHKPKHIHSWKTVLYCEKEAEAIKHCIRVNRDVSLTLYRDHRFGLEEHHLQAPALGEAPELVDFDQPELASAGG